LLDAFEQYMHDCGLYSVEDMRPVNEARMRARWKLGQALAMKERGPHGGDTRDSIGKRLTNAFWKWVVDVLGLTKPTALSAQRIGTLPEPELIDAFDQWRERRAGDRTNENARPSIPDEARVS
jgi:hypothetical protein